MSTRSKKETEEKDLYSLHSVLRSSNSEMGVYGLQSDGSLHLGDE